MYKAAKQAAGAKSDKLYYFASGILMKIVSDLIYQPTSAPLTRTLTDHSIASADGRNGFRGNSRPRRSPAKSLAE